MRLLSLALVLPLAALAQATMPTAFPAEAAAISDAALSERMAGKVYRARLADGATWRLEYKSNGYVFLNTGSGLSDSGRWSIKQGQLCTEWQRIAANCLEVRASDGAVFVKRATGEVVTMRPD